MKTIMLTILLTSILIVPVMACPKGTIEYQGICASDQPVAEVAVPVEPSDDKPHHSQIPEWQEGMVKADTPSSLAASDAKLDQERIDADHAGKKAAGIQ